MAKTRKAPKRASNGRFKSKGLFNKLSWKHSLVFLVIFAGIGGYFVWQSSAHTADSCKTTFGVYQYNISCLTTSDEARIIRLYHTTFGRAPDKAGLEYWIGRLNGKDNTPKLTLKQIADNFAASKEFKNKYDPLNNEAYVKAIYTQAFGRPADTQGLAYWKDKLDKKTITRAELLTQFSESAEGVESSRQKVASALGIKLQSPDYKNVSGLQLTCLGTIRKYNGEDWCNMNLRTAQRVSVVKISKQYKQSHASLVTSFKARLVNSGDINLGFDAKTKKTNGGFGTFHFFGNQLATSQLPMYSFPRVVDQQKLNTTTREYVIYKGNNPKNTSSQHITFNTSDYGKNLIKFTPNNSEVSIKMNSIKNRAVVKNNNNFQTKHPTDTNKKVRFEKTGKQFSTHVLGTKVDVEESSPYIKANYSKGTVDWGHSLPKVKRGQSYFRIVTGLNYRENATFNDYEVKFRLNVLRNNKILSPTKYKVTQLRYNQSGGSSLTLKPNANGVYTLKSDVNPWDSIELTINQNTAGSLKLQLDIINGPADYKIFNSTFFPPGVPGGMGGAPEGICDC